MKRAVFKKTAAIALMTMLLLQMTVVSAFAADTAQQSAVRFEGNTKPIVMIPDNSDLFTNFKKLVPGDVKKQTIAINNTAGTGVEVYLRAEDVAQVLARSELKPLVDCLSVKIVYNRTSAAETVLYEGPLSGNSNLAGAKNMKQDIYLGSYYKGTQGTLDVTLTVPSELGNEYANAEAKINWIFTFKEIDDDDDDDDWSVIDKDLGTLPKTGGQL